MRAIILLSFLLIYNPICYGSLHDIIDADLFRTKKLDNIDQRLKMLALSEISNLREVETVIPFSGNLVIKDAYVLSEYPDIYIFSIEDNHVYGGSSQRDPYEVFIFNSSDSTIYPFGSGYVRFSKVFNTDLKKIYNNGVNDIIQLVKLYLYSLHQSSNYYLLFTLDDYINLWRNSQERHIKTYLEQYGEEANAEIEKELKQLRQYFTRFSITQEQGYYQIEISTWNNISGNVEFWRFRISSKVFEVYEHDTLLVKVGPRR